uniref:Uncharacterized protein n=1 Tax=Globodera rostochiensis TaxID=31243 RepID=A0A914IDK1_GLORO
MARLAKKGPIVRGVLEHLVELFVLSSMREIDGRFAVSKKWKQWPNGLITAFATAAGPVNFIVTFCNCSDGIVPFELENTFTGERLKLRRLDVDEWRLVRCPSERDEAEWAEWEQEASGNFGADEGPENERWTREFG